MKVQNAQGNTERRRSPGDHPAYPANPLRRAARHLAEVGSGKVGTREIVGILMTHAARSRRGAMPVAAIRLKVLASSGGSAVRLRF